MTDVDPWPTASVIIPAHNEATTLPRLLDELAPASASGEFAVVVVCNGCSDGTAEVARRVPGVAVIETADASKVSALNLGDAGAQGVFPRLYLDADVSVSLSALRRVVEVLRGDEVLAASPRPRFATADRPWPVRGYYETLGRLPWLTDNPIGSGFYGLSETGRGRFGVFPDLINDDLFVRCLFKVGERYTLPDVDFTVETPHSTRTLVRAKARVFAGTRQYLRSDWFRPSEDGRGVAGFARRNARRFVRSPFLVLSARPAALPSLVAYAAVTSASRVVVWRAARRGGPVSWAQDRTTRRQPDVEQGYRRLPRPRPRGPR